jgi:2'-5' RNA ligase
VIAAPARRPALVGLYASISVPVDERIAALLPQAREDVDAHITLAHAQIDVDQLQRLSKAFGGRAHSVTLSGLEPFTIGLAGVGDFRTDAVPMPIVYVQIAEGADQLARLAAAVDVEYALRRRFAFHPHVTIGSWLDDDELDALAKRYGDFEAEFRVRELTFNFAFGTILAPRRIDWPRPRRYPLL